MEKLRELELQMGWEEDVREMFFIWEGRVSHEHETAVAISLCVSKEAILSLYPMRKDDDDYWSLLNVLCDIYILLLLFLYFTNKKVFIWYILIGCM